MSARLLLDTCVLLWLASEPARIPAKVRKLMSDPDTACCVSAISAFEIAIKHRKGKLALPLPPRQWFREVLTAYGFQEVPITSQIAAVSTEIAVSHFDPCDRFIVATARVVGMAVVTPDPLIQSYKDIATFW